MNSSLQLLSFFISFIFGIIFCFITMLNFKLIEKLKKYIQHIITFIYVIDVTIIYIIIMYHLNKGYFHIYFIMMVFVGYLVGVIIYKKFISKIIVNKILRR